MTAINAFIKGRPVLTYFVLTVTLSWGSILIATGLDGLPITAAQSEALGPLLYLGMLVGPSVAGILLTGLVAGRTGLRALLSQLLQWQVEARWYAVALLAAPLSIAVAMLILAPFSPTYLPAIFTADDMVALLLTSIVVGLMVGIFEELGWTGFAIPQIRTRYGILTTALIVGVVWGAWHFLLFWEADTFSGALPLALLLARLFAWLPAYRVLMVWVYDHTESLLVAILMHTSLVASQFVLFPATLAGVTALVSILVWAAVLWAVVAVIGLVNRGQIVQHPVPKGVA